MVSVSAKKVKKKFHACVPLTLVLVVFFWKNLNKNSSDSGSLLRLLLLGTSDWGQLQT
jgi:hypothetical protein